MIFASSMTCRSTDTCIALSSAATLRSSCGMARTTTTPDCGLITMLRPPPVPTMVRMA